MDKRVRWLWLSVSLCWMLFVLVVLCRRSASPASGGPVVSGKRIHSTSESGETAYHRNYDRGNTHPSSRQRGYRQDKTVVVVMPSPPMVSGPSTRIDRLQTIRDTWGQDLMDSNRCDLVFVVDEADAGTVEEALDTWGALETSPFPYPAGEDNNSKGLPTRRHRTLVQQREQGSKTPRVLLVPDDVTRGGTDGDGRLRYVLARISEIYDPAFLFYCNEHTYVIAENLLCYTKSLDPSDPVYLGNRFRREGERDQQGKALLNSGAAGFVLSRGSLSLLHQAWRGGEGGGRADSLGGSVDRDGEYSDREGEERGPPTECVAKSNYERGNPGITLARCLAHLGVYAKDTTGSQGGQRFNAYGPVRLAQGKIDQWYKDVHASDPGMWRAGPDCCSPDTISFHYVGPAEARAMHHILHHRETYLTEGYDEALSLWPASGESLGPYAARPKAGDETFDLLLNKIRICSAV
ncbi:unnamed protein product [Ectocarpus sp. 12 AP-2014]